MSKEISSRVFNVLQYENNPRTGADLHFGEENIKHALEHQTIKQYCYICHDADKYDEDDELKCRKALSAEYRELTDPNITETEYINEHMWVKAGETKPRHWHFVCRLEHPVTVSVMARWLNLPPQYVDVPKGRGAFLDCVEYLTHEDEKQQAEGKHLYEDEEVHANFDFRTELNQRREIKEKYHRDELTDKQKMRMAVMKEGKTMLQCENEDPVLFAEDMEKLQKLRALYLANEPMPSVRINYYIEGRSGVGKGVLSRILAKALFPGLTDKECYFEKGGTGVSFDGYDGQPVIIWNDCRAASLLKDFGRDDIYNIIDSHPGSSKQNVKYSFASLVNAVNIINGIEPYQDFLDGLAGEYMDRNGEECEAETDKGQTYRRFPMIICLHEKDFDCLINKGFAEGTYEYDQYIKYKRLVGNFGEVMKKLEGKAQEVVLVDMTKPIIDKHRELEQKISTKISDPAQIPEEFQHYGNDAGELEREAREKEEQQRRAEEREAQEKEEQQRRAEEEQSATESDEEDLFAKLFRI